MTVTPMAPPFATRLQTLLFTMLVGATFMVPAVLRHFDMPTAGERLATVPVRAGPYSAIHRQVYEETGDIDVLFVGDSVFWAQVDAPSLQKTLSAAAGRDLRVLVL